MEKPAAQFVEQLDDAWNLFLMQLGGHFQEESERWPLFLAAIRDIRRLEREVIQEYEDLLYLHGVMDEVREAELHASREKYRTEAQEREYADRRWTESLEREHAEKQRAKAIPCPMCGVAAGKPCVTPSGYKAEGGPHKARREAARTREGTVAQGSQ